jgi:hypothetical protein
VLTLSDFFFNLKKKKEIAAIFGEFFPSFDKMAAGRERSTYKNHWPTEIEWPAQLVAVHQQVGGYKQNCYRLI